MTAVVMLEYFVLLAVLLAACPAWEADVLSCADFGGNAEWSICFAVPRTEAVRR